MVKISEKQKQFIDALLADPEMHQTRAYMKVYTNVKQERAAAANASRLLSKPHVQAYMRKRMAAREKRTEITQDKILQELAKVAFADIKEFVSFRTEEHWDEHGQRCSKIVVEVKDSKDVDGRVIQEVSQDTKGGFKFKLQDKMAALDKLARHLGMFDDKLRVTGEVSINNPFAGLTTEELRQLIKDG